MRTLILITSVFVMFGCSSRSIKPDAKEVKVSRQEPNKKCKEIGIVSGTTKTVKGTQDEAIENMKQEAANKGANYVLVKQFSAYGTAVTGCAFECP